MDAMTKENPDIQRNQKAFSTQE